MPKLKEQKILLRRSMGKDSFGFSENPFALHPDPKFLYLAHSHWEALSTMMSGIKDRKGIVVVTGVAGVGKTILIYALLKDLSEKVRSAFIFNPRLDFQNMLENILLDLEVPIREGGEDVYSLLGHFRKYLDKRLCHDETVVIVIDEAQSLDEEVLEALFGLSSPESPAARLLQILLVGHPDLETKLNSEKLRPFRKRIASYGRIEPLRREETRGYLRHRLKLVGGSISEVFTPAAVNQVWNFAGGIPRVMNLLCERAFLIRQNTSQPLIDSKILRRAGKDLDYLRPGKAGSTPPEYGEKKHSYKVAKILFFIFSVGVFFLSLSKVLRLLLRN
jgi:general secretion pathway protein A